MDCQGDNLEIQQSFSLLDRIVIDDLYKTKPNEIDQVILDMTQMQKVRLCFNVFP